MSARNPKTILIVEDYADDARTLQLLFDQAGISNPSQIVLSAYDATSYLKGVYPYTERTRFPLPDVIIVDLKLPGMDGFELLEWIRSRPEFKNTLVVVVSGLDDLHSVRRAYALGANSFLTKPCNVSDLTNLIESFPSYWNRPSQEQAPA